MWVGARVIIGRKKGVNNEAERVGWKRRVQIKRGGLLWCLLGVALACVCLFVERVFCVGAMGRVVVGAVLNMLTHPFRQHVLVPGASGLALVSFSVVRREKGGARGERG